MFSSFQTQGLVQAGSAPWAPTGSHCHSQNLGLAFTPTLPQMVKVIVQGRGGSASSSPSAPPSQRLRTTDKTKAGTDVSHPRVEFLKVLQCWLLLKAMEVGA